ncbi:MAG: PASTA domain-containing protein, partial [Tissierellia bacterium]|nr:PASTA domain-containing protein [Tissierellia bacterium]
IYYLKEIADALRVAHNNNIVHRDIKPQNIMVTKDDTIKVTDFGIAKAANNATVTAGNDILGSVYYFSPEQARGKSTDVRSDIYSLGIVFFEMLTGTVPYDADNPISIALKQVQESMPKPSAIISSIPSEIDRVVLKMTNKEPVNRYSNINELLRDLNSLDLSKKRINNDDTDSDNTVILHNDEFARKEYEKSQKASNQKQIRRSTVKSPDKNRVTQSSNNKKKKNSKGKSALGVILGILLALVVATGLFILLLKMPNFGGNRDTSSEVKIEKSIKGLTPEEARIYIEDELGLTLEVLDETMRNDGFPVGTIVDENYTPNRNVKKGFVVKVKLNAESDEEFITMPNVMDLEEEEAIKKLQEAGFKLKFINVDHDDIVDEDDTRTPGVVIAQDPKADEDYPEDTEVTIMVTRKAEEAEKKAMIDVYGVKQEDAIRNLKNSGFDIGNVKEDYTDRVGKGDVMDQSIPKGEMTPVGTKVDITVSIGSSPSEEPDEPTEEPDNNSNENEEEETSSSGVLTRTANIYIPSGSVNKDIYVVRYENGDKETIYKGTIKEDDTSISIKVDGTEDAKYEIYFNGDEWYKNFTMKDIK